MARVLPDVAGPDKAFDYLVPDRWRSAVAVGAMVRIDLHGRRIGGWVLDADATPPAGVALRPLSRVRGAGPDASLVDLAGWAAWRWAGRRASLLATASPEHAVVEFPPPRLRPPAAPGTVPVDLHALRPGPPVLARLGPATDLTPIIAGLAQRGPVLVVVPTQSRAAVLAARLRRAGGDVALLPGQWAQARAGAAVVVGSRAAVWAPCPGMASLVVVDGHDEALVQEQAPTWSAAAVGVERARRAGAACVITSPCPGLELLAATTLLRSDPAEERHRWAPVEVVDQRQADPRLGLWSERVVSVARSAGTVLAVLNRTGRARLLACSACGTLAACERCGGALSEVDSGLRCARCGLERPVVCASCGSVALRRLRLGVSRAREQLEALALRPVGEVTATTAAVPDADVLVGTEAVLHRVERADAVVFLDFDQHLLAQRFRAGEQALAVLALASRLVGGRHRGAGRIVVQTRLPGHPVLAAAAAGDPGLLAADEAPLRAALRLPPASAVAAISGPAAEAYATALRATNAVEVLGPDRERWVARAPTAAILCDALAAVERPPGRLRVDVDPLDL